MWNVVQELDIADVSVLMEKLEMKAVKESKWMCLNVLWKIVQSGDHGQSGDSVVLRVMAEFKNVSENVSMVLQEEKDAGVLAQCLEVVTKDFAHHGQNGVTLAVAVPHVMVDDN